MTGWVVETLAASTMLMLVVLVLRRPIAQIFGPRIAYALWLLPALRMILPPLPEGVAETAPITPLPLAMQSVLPLVQLPRPVAAAPVDWSAPLAMIWLAGALCFFALSFVAYARFLRRVRATAQPVTMLEGIAVCASEAVDGPLAFGVIGRAVALPANYAARYAPAELDLALRHELMHHQRRDLLVNLIALLVRSIHWFNPVAYIAYRAFRADQELACDAAVLAGENDGERHAYGCALVKSAGATSGWGRLPAAACAMNGKGQLKRRLSMMNRMRNSRARALTGGAIVVVLMGTGLGLTASGGIAAEQVRHVQHRAVETFAPKAVPVDVGIAVPLAVRVHVTPQVPDVPPVGTAATIPTVPQAPAAPEAPERPEAPEPPKAPEPPEMPDMAGIEASVNAAMADAERAIAQANKAVAECSAKSRGGPCGYVDMAEIRRDVINGLREARNDLSDDDIPAKARARALAAMDSAIARVESDTRWR
jgi:bla regulator protein blaR1